MTVSVGAAISSQPVSPRKLLTSADRALYLAKNAGRDCAEVVEIDSQTVENPV